MKKILLCAMAMAAVCATASAEEVTLQVKDATDIQGTLNEEVPAGEGSQYGNAKNYKPLESLKIGEYSFTFSMTESESEPAYYYPMSTNPNGAYTIRMYGGKNKAAGNKMTVKCPEGKTMKSFILDCSQADAGAEVNASVGTATTTDGKKVVWTNSDAVSEVTLTIHVQTRFTAITISDNEAGDTPPVGGDITVKKATTFVPGEVSFVFNEGFVETFAETSNFGYWMAVSTTIADEIKVTDKAIFTIESTDKGYTIKDMYGRYMGWDGVHWSFNQYTTPEDGNSYWDVTMVDGTVKIVNKAKSNDDKEVYLAGKKYNNDYEMCPTDRDGSPLPMLYTKISESGVADIIVDGNAPAVYYNLQGVRVDNPTSGMYIVVKGGKSQKVAF